MNIVPHKSVLAVMGVVVAAGVGFAVIRGTHLFDRYCKETGTDKQQLLVNYSKCFNDGMSSVWGAAYYKDGAETGAETFVLKRTRDGEHYGFYSEGYPEPMFAPTLTRIFSRYGKQRHYQRPANFS